MSDYFGKLIKLLNELFQMDQPDLDFGFYRIMHAKAGQVKNFLENDLLKITKEAFGEADETRRAELITAYDKALQTAKDYGAPNPEETEPVRKAKAALDALKQNVSAEKDVYEHLYRFFERYYDNGDFISRRYYARETSGKAAPFAVPYNGEEVKLHWANADQYYIKTTEYFSNFTFKLKESDESPMKVHFKIVDASEGEHGNIKTSDNTKRFFIIHSKNPVEFSENGELTVNFEFRPDPEKTGQDNTWRDKRNAEAVDIVLKKLQDTVKSDTRAAEYLSLLISPAPTEKDKKRPLLSKYINQYTARNTMDYFIHKDLGGFLHRELDFYIKNEIMRLDDIENADVPAVESYLAKIKVFRKIAGKLIDFLAQLENFQKKLWLKKKFVTQTNYCITLDRVPEKFYREITENAAQTDEWINLGFIDNNENNGKIENIVSVNDMAGMEGIAGVPPANIAIQETLPLDSEDNSAKIWHTRGYLPHFDMQEQIQFITFRLKDSVPSEVIERWKQELKWEEGLDSNSEQSVALRKKIEEYEDSGKGSCYFKEDRIAKIAQDALMHFDGAKYNLLAWCIMPNHIHVLIQTIEGHPLSKVVHSWKSFIAHEANKILGRSGDFWLPEYFDRFMRNDEHLTATIEYILNNPVKAGLVENRKDYKWLGSQPSRLHDHDLNCDNGRRDACDPSDPRINFLKSNPYLVLDTKFFSEDFKARLIASIQDLEERCDGLLIHSENFQALNLLQERYREQVKCVYIDPPYNTGNDGFTYKDSYQHSSWLSMLENRIIKSTGLMALNSSFFSSIDDGEHHNLNTLLTKIFGFNNFVANIIWQKKFSPQNDAKWLSDNHDFILCYSKDKQNWRPNLLPRTDEHNERYQNPDNDPRGLWSSSGLDVRTYTSDYDYPITTPNGRIVNPPSGRCWRCGKDKFEELVKDNRIWFGENGNNVPRIKRFLSEVKDGITCLTIWEHKEVGHNQEATQELKSLGYSDFQSPKVVRLLKKVFTIGGNFNSLILDYFAGSGTTAHAVINLNREDGGKRKYILVEMGDYFDNVLKPRIQKVIYSKDWKDGKPIVGNAGKAGNAGIAGVPPANKSRQDACDPANPFNGISHIFKYIRLESYEDALNNLRFDENPARSKAIESNPSLKEDFMLRYMLNVETKGSQSLLNIDAFSEPDAYKLKVKKPGSDEYVIQNIDLIETFNYLIGLHITHIAEPQFFNADFKREPDPDLPEDQNTKLIIDGRIRQDNNGKWKFRKIEGKIPKDRFNPDNGQTDKVLIIWRNLTGDLEKDNLMLDEWFQKNRISALDFEFDIIYVNGSNNLPNLKQDNENWKVRLIEEEFMNKMWETEGI